ncbi:MAG: hypothetical protein KatS3mg129_1803 [Leptospiraceae bacterium]|nr:MAG: hypothetical protein KatS3mg129_1803 [Leptospiraceae bacterium]
MNTKIEIYTYSTKTSKIIQKTIHKYIQDTWLLPYQDNINHICDELIKNAIKSNYKLILILFALKDLYKKSLRDLESAGELIEWLKEVLFSGEQKLIAHNLKKIDQKKITKKLKELMYFEKFYIEQKDNKNLSRDHLEKIKIILKIKQLLKQFHIYTMVEFYRNPEFIHILIQNGSPILEEDFLRIIEKRKNFSHYVQQNKKNEFFIENIDTSGGGHGLGYPLIDALLLDMGLKPEDHLYLVSAKRTMVLLNLPLQVQKKTSMNLKLPNQYRSETNHITAI